MLPAQMLHHPSQPQRPGCQTTPSTQQQQLQVVPQAAIGADTQVAPAAVSGGSSSVSSAALAAEQQQELLQQFAAAVLLQPAAGGDQWQQQQPLPDAAGLVMAGSRDQSKQLPRPDSSAEEAKAGLTRSPDAAATAAAAAAASPGLPPAAEQLPWPIRVRPAAADMSSSFVHSPAAGVTVLSAPVVDVLPVLHPAAVVSSGGGGSSTDSSRGSRLQASARCFAWPPPTPPSRSRSFNRSSSGAPLVLPPPPPPPPPAQAAGQAGWQSQQRFHSWTPPTPTAQQQHQQQQQMEQQQMEQHQQQMEQHRQQMEQHQQQMAQAWQQHIEQHLQRWEQHQAQQLQHPAAQQAWEQQQNQRRQLWEQHQAAQQQSQSQSQEDEPDQPRRRPPVQVLQVPVMVLPVAVPVLMSPMGMPGSPGPFSMQQFAQQLPGPPPRSHSLPNASAGNSSLPSAAWAAAACGPLGKGSSRPASPHNASGSGRDTDAASSSTTLVPSSASSTSADSSGPTIPPSPASSLPKTESSSSSHSVFSELPDWLLPQWSSSSGSSRPCSSASSSSSSLTAHIPGPLSCLARQPVPSLLLQHGSRDSALITVSQMSSVKDAAGALAKVVSRHGSGVLLALSRVGDQAAQVTHVAAKSLAVARFYVNSRMSAEGAAGVGAAAALTGVEPPSPAAALAAAVEDELVFMPYFRAGTGMNTGPGSPEPAISFLVAKAAAKQLPSPLPPPVGAPACLSGRQAAGQQQQQQQQAAAASGSTSGSAGGGSGGAAAAAAAGNSFLKVGASTDVNKLSNAIISCILNDRGHAVMQLAGAAACFVAMKALVKAGFRLQHKFGTDIVAAASFLDSGVAGVNANNVFLQLDIVRSGILRQHSPSTAAAANPSGSAAASAVLAGPVAAAGHSSLLG